MSCGLFGSFLRHPGQIGALCPSSRRLSRAMVSGVGVENASIVAELGPGTGVITREIRAAMPSGAKLLAVEVDPELSQTLTGEFPDAIICTGCASKLPVFLADNHLPRADAVISGLPWAVFPDELQEKILSGVLEGLAENGWFTTFAYLQGLLLPAARRFRSRLERKFTEVDVSRVVWCNLPPAVIYRCRR